MKSAEKFTNKAEGYAKFRPSYPGELYDYLYLRAHLTHKSIVADLGAGTGLFTKGLLERDLKVVCVEPNAAMRFEAEIYLNEFKNKKIIDRIAEDTNLPNGVCDLVTAAQSFHWFERKLFLEECRRILKPRGKLALVWNVFDEEEPLISDFIEINKKYCPHFHGFAEGIDNKNAESYRDVFVMGTLEQKIFNNDRILTKEQYMGHAFAASYAPNPTDPEYKNYYNAVSDLYIRYCTIDGIIFPAKTVCFVGEIKDN